jgi:HEAT repeat protein
MSGPDFTARSLDRETPAMNRLAYRDVLIALGLAACIWQSALAQTPAPVVAPDETDLNKLAAVLRSDAPQSAKLMACKRLALLGNEASVAALAPLLPDPELSHPARLALEVIPSPAATAALREALGRAKGRALVGVVNSVAVRRDPQAVAPLARLLADPDPEVAAAAARALGSIATPEAIAVLQGNLGKVSPALRIALADACLACAERLRAGGQAGRAIELFDAVAKADVPGRSRAAAVRGAILAADANAGPRLAAAVKSADKDVFAMAILVARELPRGAATQVLLAELPKLPVERQALVITALGDRGDATARPAVVEAAHSATPEIRLAALRALSTLGDAGAVPLLLDAAIDPNREVAEAAMDSLTVMPEIDAVVAETLTGAAGRRQSVLMELAGRRHLVAAAPVLLKSVESSQPATRLAAIVALGGIIGPADFSALTRRLLANGSPEEQAAAKNALKAACSRRPDRQACAEALVACLNGATPEASCFLLELLATVGDDTALKAVSAATFNPDEQIQDAASRLLGEWRTPNVAPALAELARKSPSPKFQLRALRGYIRVARQMDMTPWERVRICRQALDLAQRDEERVLALEALGRCPLPEALELVVPRLRSPGLAPAASVAAVAIAEKIYASQPQQVQAAMTEVLKVTTDKTLVRRAQDVLAGKVVPGR